MSDKFDEGQPIVIKKVNGKHPHHGGAWKVAYADFVTAMMAFFLLLWLLSVTTEEQKQGIADYFSTSPMITRSEDGAGAILGGTTMSPDGAMISQVQPLVEKPQTQDPALRPGSIPPREETNISDERFLEEKRKRENEQFEKAAAEIQEMLEKTPGLKDMKESLRVDQTTEGLKIQILEQQDKPLFESGSATLLADTRQLLMQVSEIIQPLTNEVSIRGHTDSVPYGPGSDYTNWELSADRANSARKALQSAGLPLSRVNNVLGKADTDPLIPENPRDGRNRRISIILLYDDIASAEGANASARAASKEKEEQIKQQLFQRSEGLIQFP
ncbi:MAG: flagellar motor protein MotB [Pseudomonadota bacterium]